jgi:hypothetical protein
MEIFVQLDVCDAASEVDAAGVPQTVIGGVRY